MMGKCLECLKNYIRDGFKQAIISAKELAEELPVEPIFTPVSEITRVTRQSTAARDSAIGPEKKFEVEFFNVLLDISIASLKERFKVLNEFSETWGFLYDLDNLPERIRLSQFCTSLEAKLTSDSKSDIDGVRLCNECISIKTFLSGKVKDKITPLAVLKYIQKLGLQELYYNVWVFIAYYACDSGQWRAKLFQIEINQELFELYGVIK